MINNGTYKVLYIELDSVFKPVGCLTDNSFSESVEVIDSTTRQNTGGWGTSTPTRQNYSISFSGIETFDDLGETVVSYYNLQTIKRNRTKINWKIYSSLGGNTESGSGYITSLNSSASIDEAVSFDGEIIGFGIPAIEEGIPEDPLELVDMIPIYEAAKY